MTPHEVLGISPQASKAEIVAAYRTLAQIFHPDRFVNSPEAVRREAERRMRWLNEAYAAIRTGKRVQWSGMSPGWSPPAPARTRTSTGATNGPPARPRPPWDTSARARADQATRAERARKAREEAAPNGRAVARPKSPRVEQSVLKGLGEALVTNRIPCHRCSSIQWLPEGFGEMLTTTDYYCSSCKVLLLRR